MPACATGSAEMAEPVAESLGGSCDPPRRAAVGDLAAYGTAMYVKVATSWKPVTETVTVPDPGVQPKGRA